MKDEIKALRKFTIEAILDSERKHFYSRNSYDLFSLIHDAVSPKLLEIIGKDNVLSLETGLQNLYDNYHESRKHIAQAFSPEYYIKLAFYTAPPFFLFSGVAALVYKGAASQFPQIVPDLPWDMICESPFIFTAAITLIKYSFDKIKDNIFYRDYAAQNKSFNGELRGLVYNAIQQANIIAHDPSSSPQNELVIS